MASSLKISELSTELKEHLSDNPAIFSKHFSMMDEVGAHMGVYENVVDKLPLYELDVADPNQPGNRATYAPKNDVLNWKNRTLAVDFGEVTLKIAQAEIEAIHQSHLAKIAAAARRSSVYDLPFEEYMLQRVIAKSKDSLRRLAMFKGALSAVGTTSGDITDGFLTKIAADITATDIPAANVATGAVGGPTASNAFTEFKKVVDIIASQNPEYLNSDLVCYASPENVKFYNESYRSTFGSLPYNNEFKKTFVNDMSNIELIPEIGMAGSDRIIITPRFNLAMGTDALERMNNIEIEKRERAIHFLIDYKLGFEYGIAELIWCNDLA